MHRVYIVGNWSDLLSDMPVVLEIGPYRFLFFASDLGEPAHVHVKRDRADAKFWLDPVELVHNRGHRPHELRRIEKLVDENRQLLLDAWDEYFNG